MYDFSAYTSTHHMLFIDLLDSLVPCVAISHECLEVRIYGEKAGCSIFYPGPLGCSQGQSRLQNYLQEHSLEFCISESDMVSKTR